MSRHRWPWVLGALAAGLAACHLAGGLGDLDFQDGPGTTATTSAGSTTTSSGGGTSSGSSTGTAGGSDAGAGGGAGTGGSGGSPPPPCHDDRVEDTFDGSSLDGSLWEIYETVTGTMTFGVDGGVAFAQPPTNVSSWHGGDFYAIPFHDLTGCATWAEVVAVTGSTEPAHTYVGIWSSGGNEAYYLFEQGTLYFSVETGNVEVAQGSEPHSASNHRWVRFREEAGMLHLETSPNGLSWTSKLSTSTPAWITSVRIYFGAGAWAPTSTPGRGEFDHVNLLP